MLQLPDVTLVGVDCLDFDRLQRAAQFCRSGIEYGQVRLLTSLDVSAPDVIRIDPIESLEAYSAFVLKNLAAHVDTEFALIFQHDGFVLNADSWSEEFLKYDYIGAPWWRARRLIVGNGGFSLRSKRLLALTAEDPELAYDGSTPEDWFVCVHLRHALESRGVRFAPPDVGSRFSLEGNQHRGIKWRDEFGFHSLQCTDISSWLEGKHCSGLQNDISEWARKIARKREIRIAAGRQAGGSGAKHDGRARQGQVSAGSPLAAAERDGTAVPSCQELQPARQNGLRKNASRGTSE